MEIKQLAEHIRSQVVRRRNARGGRGAAEHLIAALRCVYNHAVDDGLIAEADNPARRVAKPRRLPTTRRGLPDSGIEEINRVAASTGNDPALDTLLLRLHTETACRHGGALALRPQDLDRSAGRIVNRDPSLENRHLPAHEEARHLCYPGACPFLDPLIVLYSIAAQWRTRIGR